MNDIKEDLSILTTIPKEYLEKLVDKTKNIIYNNIYEECISGNTELCIDIEIGKLYISINPEEIKYKYVPSAEFEKTLIDIVCKDYDPLSMQIEEALRNKLMNVYKEMF